MDWWVDVSVYEGVYVWMKMCVRVNLCAWVNVCGCMFMHVCASGLVDVCISRWEWMWASG